MITSDVNALTKIIVVDDDVANADLLSALLRRSGLDVRTLYSGDHLLELTKTYAPSSIILDLSMPGMNGFEAAQRIRKHEIYSQIKLIAVSGLGRDIDLNKSNEAGFNFHLIKPIDFNYLMNIITDKN